jgi:formylglycine-generating enzyme required for sulfatase activity
VVLNAGRLAQPIRACSEDWPLRSLVVIATPFEVEDEEASKAARQLAIRLLDKGSADEVLMGEQWERVLPDWLGENQTLNRNTQVLVILSQGADVKAAAEELKGHPGPWAVGSSDDFAALAKDIKNSKSQALADVLPKLELYRQRYLVCASGGPEKSEPDQNGIEWIHVCPGTFTMGTMSKEEDPMADKDEIIDSPRTVVLSGFDMAATETTQVQGDKKKNMPWVSVDWKTAREFCQQAGSDARDNLRGDLPTEAQWEYAARGGSRFPWSFGDEEALLEDYAWYNRNSLKSLQEVGKKDPNPLGLYDMHGNAWEWTRDLYGDYKSGVFVNPPESNAGNCKFVKDVTCVLRGGSFGHSPGLLRSAVRVRLGPGFGSRDRGFRCVRVPPMPRIIDFIDLLFLSRVARLNFCNLLICHFVKVFCHFVHLHP